MLPVQRRQTLWLLLILAAAALGLYAGWRLFWHLTDDAFIAFRYVSNSRLGYGYVWNPPPFRPVEGYTSFLWVLLLDGVWRLTGIAPPDSANWLALAFSAGTLALTIAMVLRLKLRPALARFRLLLLALVLLGLLTNRTFLAWTSSGLETAMHNFWLAAWVFVALWLPPGGRRWLTALALLAVLLELTRPDGLLFLAATGALVAADLWQRRRALRPADLLPLWPMLLVVAHLLWRYATYGEWLPNTYAAKYVSPWPESGMRYALSFLLEYALWFWLAAILLAGLALARRAGPLSPRVRAWVREPLQPAVVQWVVVGALGAHWAYYTFMIGGDHFEYRVYSHLVPLLLVSLVWALDVLSVRPAWAIGALTASLALALPIPWVLWAASLEFATRRETLSLDVPIAGYFPAPLQGYVRLFDEAQAWLIDHAVGVRHQEHKVFAQSQLEGLPPREAGLLLRPEAQAVRVEGAVGVIGWVLPTVAVVDAHGLADYVVARHPVSDVRPRLMAHDRYAPEGYLSCYGPNADAALSRFIIGQRPTDLAGVAPGCEGRDWPVTPWRPDFPDTNLALAPAARVLYNVWTVDPLFIYYVSPDQSPVQTAEALGSAFREDFHDAGCLVYPPPGAVNDYLFAFLPPNLRYSPEEIREIFPWTGLVDYGRTGRAVPHSLAYALPAPNNAAPPEPPTPHVVDWAPATLVGYDLPGTSVERGERVEALLYFRANQTVPTEQWFQLSLVDAGRPEMVVASDQGDPCRGMFPAWLWRPGQVIVVKAILYVAPDLAAGDYALRLGMFDLGVGPEQPLPASGEVELARVNVP